MDYEQIDSVADKERSQQMSDVCFVDEPHPSPTQVILMDTNMLWAPYGYRGTRSNPIAGDVCK